MTVTRTYPHGVTCWVDVTQPDLPAAVRFYGELFGWAFTEVAPLYRIASLEGRDVAAIGASDGGAGWHTYVAVDDADTSAAAVVAGGGTVQEPPAEAGPGGRTAACTDPAGASFRLWQARRRPGAQLVNAPGSWNFSDLHTPDADAALAFYTPLFGWKAVDIPGAGAMLQVPGYGDHLAATVDPHIHERQASAPSGFADVIGGVVPVAAGEAAHWQVTFSVADRDGSVAEAERLGATTVSTGESQWTRHALIRDPQGALLTLSQFTPPSTW